MPLPNHIDYLNNRIGRLYTINGYGKKYVSAEKEWREYLLTMTGFLGNVRKISGDGNCYYRAFLYGFLLHHHYYQGRLNANLVQQNIDFLNYVKGRYKKYEIMQTGIDFFIELIFNAPLLGKRDIIKYLNNRGVSDALVCVLRFIVADRLVNSKEHKEFIWDGVTKYIQETILTMGSWGDHVEIQICRQAFNVEITLTNLVMQQRLTGDVGLDANKIADIELLYTGDHYDVFEVDWTQQL